jgi:hypothetical protein
VNDEHHVFGAKDKDHLEIVSRGGLPSNQELPITFVAGIRVRGMLHDVFSFGDDDSVLADVVDVPPVPAEFHNLTI